MTAALRRDEVASVDRIEWCGKEQLRQLLSSSQTRLPPRLVVSPASSFAGLLQSRYLGVDSCNQIGCVHRCLRSGMAYSRLRVCAEAICRLNVNQSGCQDVCRAWGTMSLALCLLKKYRSLALMSMSMIVRSFPARRETCKNGLYQLTFDGECSLPSGVTEPGYLQ